MLRLLVIYAILFACSNGCITSPDMEDDELPEAETTTVEVTTSVLTSTIATTTFTSTSTPTTVTSTSTPTTMTSTLTISVAMDPCMGCMLGNQMSSDWGDYSPPNMCGGDTLGTSPWTSFTYTDMSTATSCIWEVTCNGLDNSAYITNYGTPMADCRRTGYGPDTLTLECQPDMTFHDTVSGNIVNAFMCEGP
ncbi:hypothetical protein WR25_22287 [Diploscapter pachys]|uniref:CUB domain-containing protein n=1 Tax=Diploscapter pachys TaxID=2018661 RepID=A0A2A2JTW7_9BILA|nr:hypothetical protein WR25_22287 [Diploscapter pachys]